MVAIAGVLAALLALVHLFGGKLHFLDVIPRSRWLSAAGGISVAYVFLHILPDLAEHQEVMREEAGPALRFLEHHVYVLALLGLTTFYGLERLATRSRAGPGGEKGGWRGEGSGAGSRAGAGVFWIHVGSFAVYNALIGYLFLHREGQDVTGLVMFFFAMATHFLVNDYGLRQHHKRRYDHYGRWLLAAAVLLGWAAGATTRLPRGTVALLFSFIAGGVVLNVLKEELPEERESDFAAFVLGAAGYSLLLVAV